MNKSSEQVAISIYKEIEPVQFENIVYAANAFN